MMPAALLLSMLALAHAQEEAAPPPEAAPAADAPRVHYDIAADDIEGQVMSLEEVWAQQTPTELLTQAIVLQEAGNRDAALARLQFLDGRDPAPLATFQLGKTLELMEDYGGALAAYDRVLARSDADAEVLHEAAFRRVLVLEDLDRHKESLAQVKALKRANTWGEGDRLDLELHQGIAELSSGKAKRGIKRIERALAALEGSTARPWVRARARAHLAGYLLQEAAALELIGDKKAARRLQERSDLMIAAEQQILAIVQLGEPEYALEGLRMIGDAYLQLYDDLLAAPPPAGLDDAQAAIYRAEVEKKATILRDKARVYYDHGIRLAERLDWQGSIRADLHARFEAL